VCVCVCVSWQQYLIILKIFSGERNFS